MHTYTDKDVAKLIADVEKAFTAQLAKAEDMSLAKSEDGEKDHEDKEEHKEKPEHEKPFKHEAKDGESKQHDDGEEHHDGNDESHDENDKEHGGQEEHHEEGHDQGHDYDEEDMQHMEKMYRSMSPGEQKHHSDCLAKCMGKTEAKPSDMSKNENGSQKRGNGGEMSACEPKDSPGAKSEASKAHGDKMEKSENQEVELLKSELASQKEKFEAVQEFLTKLAKKAVPQGKAITSLDVIAKSETPSEEKTFTKAQITEILNTKTADPSLKKSDRDAVTSYYLNGQLNVNSISHLLK